MVIEFHDLVTFGNMTVASFLQQLKNILQLFSSAEAPFLDNTCFFNSWCDAVIMGSCMHVEDY